MRHLKTLCDHETSVSHRTSTVSSGLQWVMNSVLLDIPVSDIFDSLKSATTKVNSVECL